MQRYHISQKAQHAPLPPKNNSLANTHITNALATFLKNYIKKNQAKLAQLKKTIYLCSANAGFASSAGRAQHF